MNGFIKVTLIESIDKAEVEVVINTGYIFSVRKCDDPELSLLRFGLGRKPWDNWTVKMPYDELIKMLGVGDVYR